MSKPLRAWHAGMCSSVKEEVDDTRAMPGGGPAQYTNAYLARGFGARSIRDCAPGRGGLDSAMTPFWVAGISHLQTLLCKDSTMFEGSCVHGR